jgi:hypothetical protein
MLSNTNNLKSLASEKRTHVPSENKNDIDDKLINLITKDVDIDEQFLLSHLPALKRMTSRQNSIARMKIQQVIFDIEFGTRNNYSPFSEISTYSFTSTYTSTVYNPQNNTEDSGFPGIKYYSL